MVLYSPKVCPIIVQWWLLSLKHCRVSPAPKINRSTWSLSCDSQNETWTKSQLDGEVRHENKSLCGWNRHQPQWCVTKNDSESSTVSYRCPLSQNLLFHRTFFLEFENFSRNCDGRDAISAPRLVVTPWAITPACLHAPSYPWTTLPPSLRHATGARWLLWLEDSPIHIEAISI